MKILSAFVLLGGLLGVFAELEVKYSWNVPDFEWESADQKVDAIASGGYIPINNEISGLERWQNKLFIGIPRGKYGVASSLNYIDLNTAGPIPLLKPYPKWHAVPISDAIPAGGNAQAPIENTTIVNAFHPYADVCNRLWVLDLGDENYLSAAPVIHIPVTIVLFDLFTNKVLHRFVLPEEFILDRPVFTGITVDVHKDRCDDAYAYLPDLWSYGLIVYSLRQDHAWRIHHDSFISLKDFETFHSDNITYNTNGGIFGTTLGPELEDKSRDLYYHPISSLKEYKVNNFALQNESYITSAEGQKEFTLLGSRDENQQSYREAYHKPTGVIFYTLVNENSVGCWNIKKNYSLENLAIVANNTETLVFPMDIGKSNDDEIWVLSNHHLKFITGATKDTDVNYRILHGKPSELIKGTVCESDEPLLEDPAECDETTPSKPAPSKPAPAKPAPAKPALAKPAPAKAAVKKPAPAKPAVKKPALTKPAVKKTAVKKPAPKKKLH